MRLKAGFVGAVCLVMGAATGGLFLQRAVAQGQPARPRFEYFCQGGIGHAWKPDDLQKLNALGAQGWDLVQQLVGVQGANGDVYCFKRQLP
jgi:hypothetical protein